MKLPEDFLARALSGRYGRAMQEVPLSYLSRWRIGGRCALVVEPPSQAHIESFLLDTAAAAVPVIVIGGGSNLLFSDEGFRGACLRIGPDFSIVTFNGTRFLAQAGVSVPRLARLAGMHGLRGLEHIVGIPGTLGGLVVMNGGSQRHSVSECVRSVRSIDRHGQVVVRTVDQCRFDYRQSVFRRGREIVLDVEFELVPGKASEIRQRMLGILRDRRGKFPLKKPNCGSVFVSDPGMYATIGPPGLVIERAGLKGLSVGGAMVSTRHANFFVNAGGATARDMLQLIREVRHAVHEQTGFLMRTEVLYVNSDGAIVPADEAPVA